MIFNVSTLDNQIAQLKAERDRQTQANLITEQLQLGLADLLKLLGNDQDAIATLKTELLGLFPTEECETETEQDFETISDTKNDEPEDIQKQPDVGLGESISDRVAQAKSNYYQLTPTNNPAVAYFRKHDGELGSVYIGGMNQSRLAAWGDWLYQNGYTAHPPVLRESKRLRNWAYELKLSPMPLTYVNDLTGLDYTRYPTPHSPSFQVLAA